MRARCLVSAVRRERVTLDGTPKPPLERAARGRRAAADTSGQQRSQRCEASSTVPARAARGYLFAFCHDSMFTRKHESCVSRHDRPRAPRCTRAAERGAGGARVCRLSAPGIWGPVLNKESRGRANHLQSCFLDHGTTYKLHAGRV